MHTTPRHATHNTTHTHIHTTPRHAHRHAHAHHATPRTSHHAAKVWAKPLLLYPGNYEQYGFALGLVNHGSANATIVASTVALAEAYPKFLPADSAAKFDTLELWTDGYCPF